MKKILLPLLGLLLIASCDDEAILDTPCERLLRLNPNHPCKGKIKPNPSVTDPLTPVLPPNNPEDNLPTETITNPELIAALIREGYSVRGNKLVINEKVLQTKELNLSNAGLKNLKDLHFFSKLEKIDLSGNNFDSIVFDTADLPPTVQYVNLQNNNIFEFKNLAQIDHTSGDYIVNRSFKEFIFPAQARFNVEHLLAYYKGCKNCSMKIQNNKTGNLEPLTAIRHIPSKTLYDLLKKGTSNLSNQFIDSSQSINLEEGLSIQIQLGIKNNDTQMGMNPSDLEGIEFIINNPLNKNVTVIAHTNAQVGKYTSPYIKIFKHTENISFKGINTQYIDFSQATGLKSIWMEDNELVKEIDLSTTKLFHTEGRAADTGLTLKDLPQVQKVILPQIDASSQKAIQTITIQNAPNLNVDINLRELKYIKSIILHKTNAIIEFPEELSKQQYTQNTSLSIQLSSEIYQTNKNKVDSFKDKNGNIVTLNTR